MGRGDDRPCAPMGMLNAMRDSTLTAEVRIRRARETLAILDQLLREPNAQNVAALHELHARHLREQGDDEGAARADERAARARSRAHRATSD